MGSHPTAATTRSIRTDWSRCGFGAGVLGYVVLTAVFETLPDETSLRAVWFALSLGPGFAGSCIGFTLAALLP